MRKNIKQGNISLNLISGSIKNFAISISLLGITFAGIGALFGGVVLFTLLVLLLNDRHSKCYYDI